MKILKIEGGQGFYLMPNNSDWGAIDEIDKDGLLSLLNKFLDEDVEMDLVDEENLSNQAQRIIYSNIYEKLEILSENKSKFRDESDRKFHAEIQRYGVAGEIQSD